MKKKKKIMFECYVLTCPERTKNRKTNGDKRRIGKNMLIKAKSHGEREKMAME